MKTRLRRGGGEKVRIGKEGWEEKVEDEMNRVLCHMTQLIM